MIGLRVELASRSDEAGAPKVQEQTTSLRSKYRLNDTGQKQRTLLFHSPRGLRLFRSSLTWMLSTILEISTPKMATREKMMVPTMKCQVRSKRHTTRSRGSNVSATKRSDPHRPVEKRRPLTTRTQSSAVDRRCLNSTVRTPSR